MKRKYNVLIADDEKEIIRALRLFLEKEDINVYEAYDGEMAYMIVKNYDIDLAILDIMMPRMNGFEVLKKIRQDCDIPVMILSARVQLGDKVLGLDLGADDYITKPFEPLEVTARVRANLRRHDKDSHRQENLIVFRDLTLNMDKCVLLIGCKPVDLTKTELAMMELFMSSPGRVFTRDQLCACGWEDSFVDDNTVRVAVSRLRDKIGGDRIRTIRGLGYRLEE